MSIANFLTLFRICVSPIFLLIYLSYEDLGINITTLPYVLLAILVICELSDAFDGYFARRYKTVTSLGKILDPMADSIYRISIFLTFTLPPIQLPMILIFVFLYRDFLISTLRTLCALKGIALAARPSGKLKAIIQGFSAFVILLLFIPYSLGQISIASLQITSAVIVAISAIYTVFSGLDYFYVNRHYIMKMLKAKNEDIIL